jgi:D-glycero-D-manno-heptose 1,7-bisphosphate phosphatase
MSFANRSHAMHATQLVILGRDGILNVYREGHVTEPDEWTAEPGALEAVSRMNHAGWHVVVATNQAGIGRGMIDMAAVNAVNLRMNQHLLAQGARIDAVFFCPHTPEDHCECRKPKPGMLLEIGRRYGTDLANVPFACDTLRDLLAAQAAGCEPHLVQTGRAATLSDEQLEAIVQQVPDTRVHDNLAAFADFLLRRGDVNDSASGSLS